MTGTEMTSARLRRWQRALLGMTLVLAALGCEAAPTAESDVTRTDDVADTSAGKDSEQQGTDAVAPDALQEQDVAQGKDVAQKEDTESKEDTAQKEDTSPKEDIAEGKDIEPAKDIEADKDAEPAKDTEQAVDSEQKDGVEQQEDTASAEDSKTGCETDNDCPSAGQCWKGVCENHKCGQVALDLGCDDGDACTKGEVCKLGQCQSGVLINCADGNTCTTDACDPAVGCTQTDNNNPCSDGDACTEGDVCQGGACVASPSGCDDQNPCTADSCDASEGCVYVAAPGACSDGDPCTTDKCQKGACVGQKLVCDDQNPCTKDSCEPKKGCLYLPVEAPCNDDSLCTKNDVCKNGTCTGETLVCADKDPCTLESCEPQSGCTTKLALGPCNDGDACTTDDTCGKAGCVGKLLDCDDGKPCTLDGCATDKGCYHTTIAGGAACDDGLACTVGEVCSKGECSGFPAQCDDGVACTKDSCLEPTGCLNEPSDALCVDDNVCTTDVCSPASGCSNPPLLPQLNATLWMSAAPDILAGSLQLAALGPDELLATTASMLGFGANTGVRRYVAGQEVFYDPTQVNALAYLPTTGQWMAAQSCQSTGGSCSYPVPNLGPLSPGGGAVFTPQYAAYPYPQQSGQLWLGYQPRSMAATTDGWLWTLHGIYGYLVPLQPSTQTYGTIRTDARVQSSVAAAGTYVYYVTKQNHLRRTDASGTADLTSTVSAAFDRLAANDQFVFASVGSSLWLFDHNLNLVGTRPLPGSVEALAVWGPDALALATADGIYRLTLGPAACDDGLPCTVDTACVDLACVGTTTCDDADACTTDACTPEGCTHTTSDDLCDDGDACTTDSCDAANGCSHTEAVCSDDNPCTNDTCNPLTGCSFLMPMPGVAVSQWAAAPAGVGLGHTQLAPLSSDTLLLTNSLGPVSGMRVLQNGQVTFQTTRQIRGLTQVASTGQWFVTAQCGGLDLVCDFGDVNVGELDVAALAPGGGTLLTPLHSSMPYNGDPALWRGTYPLDLAVTDDGWVWVGHASVQEGLMPYHPASQTYGTERMDANGWGVVAVGNHVYYTGRDQQLHRTSASGLEDLALPGAFVVLAASDTHVFATIGTTLWMLTLDLQVIGQVTLPEEPYAMTAWGPDRLAIASATGIYTLDLDGAPCDDGDPCTLWDSCSGTTCTAGTPDTSTPACLPPE